MSELWKDVTLKGYEIYKVSSKGNIKREGRLLKKGTNKYGYYKVNLCVKNIRKSVVVHRLVALAFIPNPNNYETVNHKDGNKKNNNIENLEWVTSLENLRHAKENHLFKFWNALDVYKENSNVKIGTYYSIRTLCKELKLINRREVTIAAKNGFSYRGYSFKIVS